MVMLYKISFLNRNKVVVFLTIFFRRFLENEEMHNKPNLPVSKEVMRQYRMKLKEIQQRPIRKVMEANARKKMKLKKRIEKVKRQATRYDI